MLNSFVPKCDVLVTPSAPACTQPELSGHNSMPPQGAKWFQVKGLLEVWNSECRPGDGFKVTLAGVGTVPENKRTFSRRALERIQQHTKGQTMPCKV